MIVPPGSVRIPAATGGRDSVRTGESAGGVLDRRRGETRTFGDSKRAE